MNIKGFDQLYKHIPDLKTPGGRARIGLTAAGIFALTTLFFIATDRLIPEWQPDGEIIVMALGFLLVAQFFAQKKAYQARYGVLAYRNAFLRFCLPGLSVIFAALAHVGYMPGPQIPDLWWKPILTALGWTLVVVGAALWARAVFAFGADNLAMLYVYFPAEGRLVESSIYSVLRHPVYAGVLRAGIGLALLNGNWFAVFFAALMPLGLTGWVRLVEEKELLERFGQDYVEYRGRVPAFWPRPRDLGTFLRFLLTGE